VFTRTGTRRIRSARQRLARASQPDVVQAFRPAIAGGPEGPRHADAAPWIVVDGAPSIVQYDDVV
jgi:hypothetical protein